jgi:hypothetical protein
VKRCHLLSDVEFGIVDANWTVPLCARRHVMDQPDDGVLGTTFDDSVFGGMGQIVSRGIVTEDRLPCRFACEDPLERIWMKVVTQTEHGARGISPVVNRVVTRFCLPAVPAKKL